MSGSASSDVVSAAQAVTLALRPRQTAVLAEDHMGEWFSGIGGASIYLVPPRKQRISPYYAGVSLARDTRWHEMLQAYHAHFA